DRLAKQRAQEPDTQQLFQADPFTAPDTPAASPWPTSIDAPAQPQPAPHPRLQQEPAQNLAQRAAAHRRGQIQRLLGGLFGILALVSAYDAVFGADPFEGGSIVRTLILFFASRMLFVQG